MQKVTPCLWFDSEAEEAAKMYVDVFNTAPGSKKTSKVGDIRRYDKAGAEVSGRPEGSVLTAGFELDGQKYVGLNGGPYFKFTGAVSFMIHCKTQEEVDHFWTKLSANKEAEQCGWLQDKFGLSWQVVPDLLDKLLADPDPVKAGRVMEAMLQMKKIDIAGLQSAYEGK
jgi:predicted 3-demethylubiquinone-9 3-methyltransferase (glyoxalase superfamily)